MNLMAPVLIVGSLILGLRILLTLYGQRKSGLCYSCLCVCVGVCIYRVIQEESALLWEMIV